MRHVRVIACASLAILAATAAPAAADILVAVAGPMSVTPLTGQYATFGEELRRGADMAVRDINARGGVNGQQLTLLTADDACDPKLAVEVAEELARQRVAFVDGHFCSGASIAASLVYHERGILMIGPSSTNPYLTEQGFANVFRVSGRDDRQGRFAADYAVDNGLADRIAIVQDQTTFGKGLADEFGKRLNERGFREAMDEAISQGDNDFGALIARMRDAGIRLVYFGGYHTEAGLFVRQARHLGLDATMMVNSAMLTREYWDLAGPAAEGTLMTFGPDPRRLPSAVEVVARFAAEGHEAEARTLYSYAAVQVFADAARKAGSTDHERLEGVLHADTFQTVLGPMTFDAKGDNVRYEFRMYRWHDGKYEEICCRRSGEQ